MVDANCLIHVHDLLAIELSALAYGFARSVRIRFPPRQQE
jgi:hypothetical protein